MRSQFSEFMSLDKCNVSTIAFILEIKEKKIIFQVEWVK